MMVLHEQISMIAVMDGVIFTTTTPHNILSKPLTAYPYRFPNNKF